LFKGLFGLQSSPWGFWDDHGRPASSFPKASVAVHGPIR
jgi:hypothetical protein